MGEYIGLALVLVGGIGIGAIITVVMIAAIEDENEEEDEPKIRTVATIGEEELLERFTAAPGHPLFEAINVVIDEQTMALVNDTLDENLSEPILRARAGGAAALTALKEELKDWIQRAQERQAEKEKAQHAEQAE